MAIIANILGQVDAAAAAVGATAFSAVAAQIIPVFRIGSVLVVALIGINLMAQAVPMTLRNGLGLMVRIAVASAFLSSWTNFNAVYGVLTNSPSEIGAVVMNAFGGGAGNLYEGLDNLYLQALDVGQAISQNGSYITGALAGLLMFLIAALMATVSIIVISAAKIMIGVLVIFAPIAIACTIFKITAPIFDRWVNLALGFAFYPMLTSGMAAFTIAIARDLAPASIANVAAIGDVLSFVVVMMLGTGLMAMVPTIAQSLAQTATGLGGIAASTMRAGGSAASYGRSGVAGGIGMGRGAAGLDAGGRRPSEARLNGNVAGQIGRSAVQTAIRLASKTPDKS
ncbi:MAG: type IV secretion system protein [bacterium]